MVEEDLLAAIAADVDSDEPRLIYADWLLTRDDPRGELIILQHRLAADPTLPHELHTRARELLEQMTTALRIASMQREVIAEVRLGFVERLKLTKRAVSAIRENPGWLDTPALRCVHELDLAIIDPRAWEIVAAWRHRGQVRRLVHGSTDKAVDPANLSAIVAQLPQLTSLKLRAPAHLALDVLAPLPLEAFELEVRRLEERTLAGIFAMPWRLHTLSLRADPIDSIEAIAPLLAGTVFPEVRDLEVVGCPASIVVARLVASGRIASIATLRLDFAGVAASSLVPFRDALAPIRLVLPIKTSLEPIIGFALVLAQLGRHAEAVASFERGGIPYTNPTEVLRWYAIAARELGDRDRARALFPQIFDNRGGQGSVAHAEVLAVANELLQGDRDPEVVVHHARALAGLGHGAEALAALADAPPSASVHLVRALAYDLAGDPARSRSELAAAEALGLGYRAMAVFLRDEFSVAVGPDHVTPAEIAAALGVPGSLAEVLDAAEIAFVAAVCAGDRRLARLRVEAIDAENTARPWNPDLSVVCAHRERGLDPLALRFVHAVHSCVRRNGSIANVVRFDAWLAQPA